MKPWQQIIVATLTLIVTFELGYDFATLSMIEKDTVKIMIATAYTWGWVDEFNAEAGRKPKYKNSDDYAKQELP